MSHADLYPPYGRMIFEWESGLGFPNEGSPPNHWNKGKPDDWTSWLNGVADLLGEILWPRWIPGQKWQGSATAIMHDLTLADFELLKSLRSVFDADAQLPGGALIAQRRLFRCEDEEDAKDPFRTAGDETVRLDMSVDVTLNKYLEAVLDDTRRSAFVKAYIDGLWNKSGNVDLELKPLMQRPRAYQMAFILNQEQFSNRQAKSALTPSMISGHCLEMCLGGVDGFYRAKAAAFPQAAIDALAQHTIDVGDRRVFGGVHYPSDNLSSWISSLLLCPNVCDDDEGAQWLWAAIETRSAVYARVRQAVEEGVWPYQRSFDLLREIGARKVVTVEQALDWAAARPLAAE
ncbi:hypothetical protein LJR225_000521 [Phenylobacterium sp. LjRoot225]|uniref:hypothetical protein n=1 Tax=Phenylobacterium sp. LjRoot225 TaxID=3342285 RepID=UPI003ECD3492